MYLLIVSLLLFECDLEFLVSSVLDVAFELIDAHVFVLLKLLAKFILTRGLLIFIHYFDLYLFQPLFYEFMLPHRFSLKFIANCECLALILSNLENQIIISTLSLTYLLKS